MVTLNTGKLNTKCILNCIVFGSGYFRNVILFCNIFIMTFEIILKTKQSHKREETYSIKFVSLHGEMGREGVTKLSDFYPE